ncbi:hypothetical protein [Paraburkholderia diazotrophica]|uniref:hypothetical protein n=1 Tax=Paraburkholderia diazotrophica TaxID=667676 RepID=UPI003173DC89
MAIDERSLQREYEHALTELLKRFEAVRTLSEGDSIDPLAVQRAREAYERTRLLWLSCDLRLRSFGIASPSRFRQSKGILIYSATENIRHSLVALLKAHAYVPTAVATVSELHTAARTSRFAAVLVYIEPAMRRAPLFTKYLELVSQPITLISFPRFPTGSIQPDIASAVERMPSPSETLFSKLDSAIKLASAANRAPHAQSPLQLAGHSGSN